MKTLYLSIILGAILAITSNSACAYDGAYSGVHSFFTQNLHLELSVNLSTDFILAQSVSNFSTTSGIIVPLYGDPEDNLDHVIQTKIAHPLVPILAVINPQNGSGHFQNPQYTEAVKKLQSEGVIVLGYVYTQYGSRNNTEIKTEITNYKNWYDANGIYFDEMSNVSGNETFYKNLNDYTKSIGMNYTVGNPGQDIPQSYIGTVDNIIIHDNPGLPPISLLGGWHANFSKNNFSIVSFDVDKFNQSYVKIASNYVKYLYITNGTMPDPWNSMSPYLENLAASIPTPLTGNQSIKIKTSMFLPLKQFKSGIAAKDVTCKEGLQLVIKTKDSSPACVRSLTAAKLVTLGWAKILENIGAFVTLAEGQRDGPLLVQKILPDSIQGLDFREYPLATNVGYPITLHIGDSTSNGCTVELTLVKIDTNTATFLKKEYQSRPCPICLSENTVIDTPNGPINVKDLKVGMTVLTQDISGHKQTGIILKTGRTLVSQNHTMIHLVLADKRELFVLPNHPTADKRLFGDLLIGDVLDGSQIKIAEHVPYNGTYTYDILPSGQTGFYWADGILVASTLK